MYRDATATPLDELFDQGPGPRPEPAAEHLRTYLRFEMVCLAGEVIRKTGHKPYF